MPAPGGQSHARREYASFRFVVKELRIPDNVKGDSLKIMKYIMNLPEQNVGIMWRRAKRYNVVAEWQLRD